MSLFIAVPFLCSSIRNSLLSSQAKHQSKASTIFGYLISNSFRVPLYYVVLRTSLWFQGLPVWQLYYTDFLDFISGFSGMLSNPFIPCWQKNRKMFVCPQIKAVQFTTSSNILKAKLFKDVWYKYVKIFKFTPSLPLLKDTFRESIGVAELKLNL